MSYRDSFLVLVLGLGLGLGLFSFLSEVIYIWRAFIVA